MRAERLLLGPILAVLAAGVVLAVVRAGGSNGERAQAPEITLAPTLSPTFSPPAPTLSPTLTPTAEPTPTPSAEATIPPEEVNPNTGQPGTSPEKRKPGLPASGVAANASLGIALLALAAAVAAGMRRSGPAAR